METRFKVDSIVLAKFSNYRWWPAAVKGVKNSKYRVVFLSDFTEAVLSSKRIREYSKDSKSLCKPKQLFLAEEVAERIINGGSSLGQEILRYSREQERESKTILQKKVQNSAEGKMGRIQRENLGEQPGSLEAQAKDVKEKLQGDNSAGLAESIAAFRARLEGSPPTREILNPRLFKTVTSILAILSKVRPSLAESLAHLPSLLSLHLFHVYFQPDAHFCLQCNCFTNSKIGPENESKENYKQINYELNSGIAMEGKGAEGEEGQKRRQQSTSADWTIPDLRVSGRVMKKIAKEIHRTGGKPRVSKDRCNEVAQVLEGEIKRNSKNFFDYKSKVIDFIHSLPSRSELISQHLGKSKELNKDSYLAFLGNFSN